MHQALEWSRLYFAHENHPTATGPTASNDLHNTLPVIVSQFACGTCPDGNETVRKRLAIEMGMESTGTGAIIIDERFAGRLPFAEALIDCVSTEVAGSVSMTLPGESSSVHTPNCSPHLLYATFPSPDANAGVKLGINFCSGYGASVSLTGYQREHLVDFLTVQDIDECPQSAMIDPTGDTVDVSDINQPALRKSAEEFLNGTRRHWRVM